MRRDAGRAALAVAALWLGGLLAACGSAPASGSPAGGQAGPASTTAPPGAAPSGGTGAAARCGARVLVPEIRSERACVRAGRTVLVRSGHRAGTSYLRNWEPVVSSDAGVIVCHSTSYPNGSVAATCRALRAGTATLTSALVYAAGGPPQGRHPPRWRAVVTVVP